MEADRSPCPPQLSSVLPWSDCGSAHNCCARDCVCVRFHLRVSVLYVQVCVCTAARAVSHRPLGGRIVLAVCPAVTKLLGRAEQQLAGN